MVQQRFSFLLILLMVITPASSAFSHYSSMASALLAQPAFEQSVAVSDLVGDAVTQNADQCHPHSKAKPVCETNASCSFHVCGHGGIIAAFLFLTAHNPYCYEQLGKSVFTSRSFSPAIRPPILPLQA